MIETLLSAMGVMFTPTIVENLALDQKFELGMVSSLIAQNGAILGIIVLITLLFNIIRAFRFCPRDKKGLLCGIIAMCALVAVGFVPVLKIPFTVIGFIPGLANYVDGFILAVIYLFSYIFFAYPIWRAC